MRRYADLVDVRRGVVAGREAPEQFLWRGRLWVVRTVVAHWVTTGAWWERIEESDPLAEQEVWRVEAGRGRAGDFGVFDLAFDWADGRWLLIGCVD